MYRGSYPRLQSAPTAFPLMSVLASNDTVNTTPATKFTLALPTAGTYFIEGKLALAVATVTGTRTQSATVNVTNLTSMNIGADVATSAPAAASRAPITASGASQSVGLASNQSGWIEIFGDVVVSAASSLTIDLSVSGDTSTLRGASFVRATRRA